jgi:hypothetical protein
LRQRRGARLGELQLARGRSIYFATAPAHTQRTLCGAQSSRGKRGKTTLFSRSGYTLARHLHFMFPVPNFHTEFLTFLRSSFLTFDFFSGFCSKLRAPHRGTSLGPFVCGAQAFSLCS